MFGKRPSCAAGSFTISRLSTGSISAQPIPSNTFATVRLRTDKTRGAVSKETIAPLVFKLVRVLRSAGIASEASNLGDVIEGVQFRDGLKLISDKQEKTISQIERSRRLPNLYTRFDYISTMKDYSFARQLILFCY